MTFKEASEILNGRKNFVKKDGLDRVYSALGKLGNPHERIRAVHVTGTNGKGSVCALFDSVFRAAGYKTGLFVSPHLVNLTERIKIDGAEISEAGFAALLEEVFKAGPDLSFFELLTCMAFLYFERAGTDIAVIEVGIGGRFDTTNVLPRPELSVITSVDYDHTGYLGNTLEEIAGQKAGIIKKGGVCLSPSLPLPARGQVQREAREKGARAYFLPPVFETAGCDWKRGRLRLRHKTTGEELEIGIVGEAQVSNATLVYEGVSILNKAGFSISPAAVAEGFARVDWPGRFQVLVRGGTVYILDGAHNPEAVKAFAATFDKSPFRDRGAVFLVGLLNDKDYMVILRTLALCAAKVVFTRPLSERAMDPCALADEFSRLRPEAVIEVQEDIEAALASASKTGTVVVLGSFYLVGSVLKMLREQVDKRGKV